MTATRKQRMPTPTPSRLATPAPTVIGSSHARHRVRVIIEHGRTCWPDIDLPDDGLADYLEERLDPDVRTGECEARASDLFLACGCTRGHPRAIEEFSRLFAPDILRAARRVATAAMSADDACQLVLQRILVPTPNRPGRIASYCGRGSLRNWVRATAVRALIDMFRRGAREAERSIEYTLLLNLEQSDDPELAYLRRLYRAEFARAFESAVAALEPRAQNHLRHVFVEQLTIDQIGALYGVHRSTAARRLASARESLLKLTREGLMRRLDVGESEVDSIVRLIGSQLDVSVQRIFGAC